MTTILKPCHCGHNGFLVGIQHKEGYLSLTCPECRRTVEAFTSQSLADAWNKPADKGGAA
jgi:phage FluMu protein Com